MARKLRYNDEEGGMVKAQLIKIENYAAKLNDMIHPDDEIEGWVQAKLAVVAAYMGDVKHYLDYELKESFGDGGGVGGFKPKYWEVEFTWDGEEEGDGRKVNVMADSVSDAERKVKDKFGPYYKGLRIVEVEEDKEMSWDEYAASKSKKERKKFDTWEQPKYSDAELDEMTRIQMEHDEQQLRREQGFADGGMMAKGGGVMSDTAYKRRMKKWGHIPYGKTKGKYTIEYDAEGEKQSEIWDTKEMAVDNAKRYKKIQDFSNIKIKDESGKNVEFAKGGTTPLSISEMLWKKYDKKEKEEFLIAAGYSESVSKDLSAESWDSLEKAVHTNLAKVLQQGKRKGYGQYADGGDIEEFSLWVIGDEPQKIKTGTSRAIKSFYTKNQYTEQFNEWKKKGYGIQQWPADATKEEVVRYNKSKRGSATSQEYAQGGVLEYADGGETKEPAYVEIAKPTDLKLNKVRRKVEELAEMGYKSADIILKMLFVTDEPKALVNQFQTLKNQVFFQKGIKKFYKGGKMEDLMMRYEGSSFAEDFREAREHLGEEMWKDMTFNERVEATKYLKAQGHIGYYGEEETLETIASMQYAKGGEPKTYGK